MSEKTVICSNCDKCVPKKPYCCECGTPLSAVTQVTESEQSKTSTPVQVTDSATGGPSIDTVKEPPILPTMTPSQTAIEIIATPSAATSYAETTQLNLSNDGKLGDQHSTQRSSASIEHTAPTEKLSVAESKSDGPDAKIDSGTSKISKKVDCVT